MPLWHIFIFIFIFMLVNLNPMGVILRGIIHSVT